MASIRETSFARPKFTARAYALIAAAVAFALGALNAGWIATYRSGPFDIDEAGYIGLSLDHLIAMQHQGVVGFVQVLENHGPSAPLVPVVAATALSLAGQRLAAAFAVTILAYFVTLLASYAIARLLAPSAIALLAMVAVGGAPVMLDYTRTFQFAMPATAFFTLSLFFLLQSDHLQGRGAALAAGASAGGMLLCRTMTVAFIPGLVVAAALAAATSPRPRRSAVNLAGAGALLGAIAALWYVSNAKVVGDYLVGTGYGAASTQYGSDAPFAMLAFFQRTVNEYLYLPAALVVITGTLVGAGLAVRRWLATPGLRFSARVLRIVRLPHLIITVAAVAGVAALMSSRNEGTGFIAPLVPGIMVLAVVALSGTRSGELRAVLLAGVGAAAVLGIVTKSGLPPFVGGPFAVVVPVYGYATAVNPAGPISIYERDGGYGDDGLKRPASDRNWQPLERELVRIIDGYARDHGESASVAYGFRDRFFNPNTVNLQSRAVLGYGMPAVWLDPISDSISSADAERWLKLGPAHRANILLTADLAPSEIPPAAHAGAVEGVAARDGFSPVDHLQLPNQRRVTVWWRPLKVDAGR